MIHEPQITKKKNILKFDLTFDKVNKVDIYSTDFIW